MNEPLQNCHLVLGAGALRSPVDKKCPVKYLESLRCEEGIKSIVRQDGGRELSLGDVQSILLK